MTLSADNPYRLPPAQSDHPGNLRKQAYIEAEQVRRMAETPQRPANMAFFEQRLSRASTAPKSRPRIGYLCNLVPVEIMMAANADPVRLDNGNGAAAAAGEEILAGDICPLAKATLGVFLRENGLPRTCDAYVVPAACDAKRKLAEILSDFAPVFAMALPPDNDSARHASGMAAELKRLAAFTAGITGTAPDRRRLRDAIGLTVRRSDIVRRLQEARVRHPEALALRDLFLCIQSSLFSPEPLETWLEPASRLLTEVEAFTPERRRLRPRIILTGAPAVWPNFKVLNVLEECGADAVADTLCTGAQACIDPAVLSEDSLDACLRALAARSIFGAACPCFTSQVTRLNRVLDLVEQTGAAGVVQYSLRLCQSFDMENYRLERILKGRRIPFLNLRTDYSLEDTEQLRVRIEAFLETL